MGIDKFFNDFFRIYSDNKVLEEIIFDRQTNIFPIEHIFFDFNSTLYKSTKIIENDINTVIKFLYALQYSDNSKIKIIKKIEEIFNKKYWSICKNNIDTIFSLSKIDKIYDSIVELLFSKNNDPFWHGLLNYQCIIINYSINKIVNILNKLHIPNIIKSISFFFDGIPSTSKIFEQRRKRITSYMESLLRKKIFSDIENLPQSIIETDYDGIKLKYNYNEILIKSISLQRPYFPKSHFMNVLYKILKSNYLEKKLEKNKFSNNIDIHISNTNDNGEGELKICSYFWRNLNKISENDRVMFHSSDSDIILLSLLTQNILNMKNIKNTIFFAHHDNFKPKEIIQISNTNDLIDSIFKNLKNNNFNNYRINFIFDFVFILFLFGNDYLPSIQYTSFDKDFNIILFIYLKFNSNKDTFLINLPTETFEKFTINIKNFHSFLIQLNESKSLESIFIKKYLLNKTTLNINFFNILKEYDITKYHNIIDSFIKPYWYFKTWNDIINPIKNNIPVKIEKNTIQFHILVKNFKETDINILVKKIKTEKFNHRYNFNIFTKNIGNLHKLDNYLFSELIKTWGIMIEEDNFNTKSENKLSNIYQYYSYISICIFDKLYFNISKNKYKHPIKYYIDKKYKKISKNNSNTQNYLVGLYYLVDKYFNICFDTQYDAKFWFYPSAKYPLLVDLLDIFNNSTYEKINDKINKILKKNSNNNEMFFDYMSHHLFITPYLKDNINMNQLLKNVIITDEEKKVLIKYIEDDPLSIFMTQKDIDSFLNSINTKNIKKINIKIWDIDPWKYLESWKDTVLSVRSNYNQLTSSRLEISDDYSYSLEDFKLS